MGPGSDISRDQPYYFTYYVGQADGKSADFTETIYQWDFGFEWKLDVNDGQGGSTNLAVIPQLRDDLSTFFDVYTEGDEYLFINCRHGDDCNFEG